MCGRMNAILLSLAVWAAPLTAQTPPRAPVRMSLPVDVAITYSGTYAELTSRGTFWMQGGGVELHGRFYGGIGVVADIDGMHAAKINSAGDSLDLVVATFGPRYTWPVANGKYEMFGQALAGEAFGFNSIFPATAGVASSQFGLAVKAGGGMNIALARHLALRACEVDWVRTQLANASDNAQNNLQAGAGLVFRFR